MLGVDGCRDGWVGVAPDADVLRAYVAPDLATLAEPQPAVEHDDDGVAVGGWRAHVVDGVLEVDGGGATADWWRAVAEAAWSHLDAHGQPVATDGVRPPE